MTADGLTSRGGALRVPTPFTSFDEVVSNILGKDLKDGRLV